MAANFAARQTRKTFSAGDLTLTVTSGSPIQVYGIILSNPTGGAATVTIADGDGTTIVLINLATLTSWSSEVKWMADQGLSLISSAADVQAVVFHNSPGN